MAVWLVEQVGPAGAGVATDVDIRYLQRRDIRRLADRRGCRVRSPWARWLAVTLEVMNELGSGDESEPRELEAITTALADPPVWVMRELLHACWAGGPAPQPRADEPLAPPCQRPVSPMSAQADLLSGSQQTRRSRCTALISAGHVSQHHAGSSIEPPAAGGVCARLAHRACHPRRGCSQRPRARSCPRTRRSTGVDVAAPSPRPSPYG
jgi:hypothetical protein